MLTDALDTYLLDCSVRLSPHTLRWYREKLEHFAEWAGMQHTGEEPGGGEVRLALLNRYLLHLKTTPSTRTGKPLSSHTIHGYAQVVSGFLRWCGQNDYGPVVLPGQIKLPKVTQKVIEVFSVTQLKRMLTATAQEETPWLAARDRAILLTLLDTGIRASELCGLQTGDLHLQEGYLRVLGKGNKERTVGFGSNTKQTLISYLRRYRPRETAGDQVFVNKRRDALTVSGLDQMLYRVGAWAGIEGVRCSAHTFRHTYAVNFLLRGGDLYALSRSLGHTSVSTTEIYLRAAKDRDLRRVTSSVADNLLTR